MLTVRLLHFDEIIDWSALSFPLGSLHCIRFFDKAQLLCQFQHGRLRQGQKHRLVQFIRREGLPALLQQTRIPKVRLVIRCQRKNIFGNKIGSFRSQYITISSNFTDAFLPSSPHSTSIRLALRRLCYRRCLIAGMFLAVAVTVAFQCLSKK